MRRLLVLDELVRPTERLAFPDANALCRVGGEVTAAVRRTPVPELPSRRTHEDGDVTYVALAGMRRPGTRIRELAVSPRHVLRLARECRAAPLAGMAAFKGFVRHLPLARLEADIVHFESVELAVAYPALGRFLDAPVIVSCWMHELERAEQRGGAYRSRVLRALAAPAAIHCPSESVAERVRALTGRSTGIWVIGPGMVLPQPSPARPGHRDTALIVAAAPLRADAGLEHLLVAFAALRKAGVDFRARIVGNGPLRQPLRWAIEDLELGGLVELVADERGAAVSDALAEADIFVAPGPGGTGSGHLLAAMAAGLPVVATAGADGVRELVRDGVDGHLVADRDVVAMADVLGRLVRDVDARHEWGAAARERVEREFTVEVQAARFDALYESVLDDRSRAETAVHGAAAPTPLRIARYARTFPKKPDLVRQAVALVDLGVDVQIFAGSPSAYANRFPDVLVRRDLAPRVHYLTGRRQSPWGSVGSSSELRRAIGHPLELKRFVAHNWRTRHTNGLGFARGVWTRLAFVGRPIDVLHVESDTWAFDVADLKGFLGCPVLLSSLATLQRTSVATRGADGYAELFRLADGYQFVSDYVRANTVALGLEGVPTWVAHCGVDTDLFSPPSERPVMASAPLHVLSVGRLSWEKGYEWALEAIASARAAGTPVVYSIAGGGPDESAIRLAVSRLGLDDVVRFLGNLGIGALVGEYRRADVLLHAAVDEAFPLAVLEAMSTGLPVVTTDAGGLPEAIDDGVTGFVVHRRDPDALARKLTTLAADPTLRRRMGEAARARAVDEFDVRQGARRMAAIYTELAQASNEQRRPGHGGRRFDPRRQRPRRLRAYSYSSTSAAFSSSRRSSVESRMLRSRWGWEMLRASATGGSPISDATKEKSSSNSSAKPTNQHASRNRFAASIRPTLGPCISAPGAVSPSMARARNRSVLFCAGDVSMKSANGISAPSRIMMARRSGRSAQ